MDMYVWFLLQKITFISIQITEIFSLEESYMWQKRGQASEVACLVTELVSAKSLPSRRLLMASQVFFSHLRIKSTSAHSRMPSSLHKYYLGKQKTYVTKQAYLTHKAFIFILFLTGHLREKCNIKGHQHPFRKKIVGRVSKRQGETVTEFPLQKIKLLGAHYNDDLMGMQWVDPHGLITWACHSCQSNGPWTWSPPIPRLPRRPYWLKWEDGWQTDNKAIFQSVGKAFWVSCLLSDF